MSLCVSVSIAQFAGLQLMPIVRNNSKCNPGSVFSHVSTSLTVWFTAAATSFCRSIAGGGFQELRIHRFDTTDPAKVAVVVFDLDADHGLAARHLDLQALHRIFLLDVQHERTFFDSGDDHLTLVVKRYDAHNDIVLPGFHAEPKSVVAYPRAIAI